MSPWGDKPAASSTKPQTLFQARGTSHLSPGVSHEVPPGCTALSGCADCSGCGQVVSYIIKSSPPVSAWARVGPYDPWTEGVASSHSLNGMVSPSRVRRKATQRKSVTCQGFPGQFQVCLHTWLSSHAFYCPSGLEGPPLTSTLCCLHTLGLGAAACQVRNGSWWIKPQGMSQPRLQIKAQPTERSAPCHPKVRTL